jgi:phenylalanyl-tRNA synthetase beta chain
VMRQTLLFGGLESIVYNQNRKNSDVRFYEFGKLYLFDKNISGKTPLEKFVEEKHLSLFLAGNIQKEAWNTRERKADFYDLKEYVNAVFVKTGIDLKQFSIQTFSDDNLENGLVYFANNRQLVCFGRLKQRLLDEFDCRQQIFYADFNWDTLLSIVPQKNLQYREMPKFPEVRRDLALLLDKSVTFAEIEKLAFETEKRILRKVSLFDVYEGEKISHDKKSYALSFILQDENKTLKDEEIDRIMNNFMRNFKEKLKAQIR